MLGLVALALISSPCAMAQDPGFYLGFNVGQAKARVDDEKITSSLLGAGFTTTSISNDERGTGFKLFAGYRFNKYFSLEGGYFDLGKFSFDANTMPAGTLSGELRAKGVNLDAVLSVPFTEKFSAFVRVGANHASVHDSFAATGAVNVLTPNPSENATNIKYGAGIEYDFTRRVGMRAEVERYRINDPVQRKGDIDLVSLGLVFRFGKHEEESAARVETPPPPPPPEPAPVLVVVPVPAETQQYCTILDIQFEVDQDDIQREEKEKLGVIGTFLNKYPDATAVIEGHTDDVGTPEHNMELSKNRAQSVVSYLVENQHIAPSRLTAVGYGDSRPIADNSTDEGKRQNRRIDAVVACVTDVAGLAVAPARMTMALVMEYDLDKAEVKPKYHDDLLKVADFMKAHPGVTATVEGHTGNATPANSMEVSQLRAQNVVNYLADNFGIARSRLTAEGFGQSRRVAYNTSTEGRQENRRVNIIFNYPK
jgi:OOP family OmpA-OmpF porin